MCFYRGECFDKASSVLELRKTIGFVAASPDAPVTVEAMIEHILTDTRKSPFVSITSDKKAASYLAIGGALFHIRLSESVQLVDPRIKILEWLISNDIAEGETFERAWKAIERATKDGEWLVIGGLPSDTIIEIEEL